MVSGCPRLRCSGGTRDETMKVEWPCSSAARPSSRRASAGQSLWIGVGRQLLVLLRHPLLRWLGVRV